MRKTNEHGIPESSEFIEELDTLFLQLDEKSQGGTRLSREEYVILDVYLVIGSVEGDGLLSFWDSNDDIDRILESFRMLGANDVAGVINETKWVKDVISRGIGSGGYYKITETEEKSLAISEESLYELFNGLPTRLLQFAKENNING